MKSAAMMRAMHTTHGLSKTPEFRIWIGIKTRCFNRRDRGFLNYGARGITLARRWRKSFAAFFKDVGPRPSPRHTIERIDNDRGYVPGNVKWATTLEQGNNKRTNVKLQWKGNYFSIAEWARRTGLKATTIGMRLKRGWSVERTLSEKP